MNDNISKKKQNSDSSAEKTYYNINSFRGLKLKLDKAKQTNEIKINNYNNLTSRYLDMNNNISKNNKENEKSRTISRNKIISNKMQANCNTVERNKTNK